MKKNIPDFIAELAVAAGHLAAGRRRKLAASEVHTKDGNHADLVTDVDREVENFIFDAVRQHYPDAALYGEESGKRSGNDCEFVIDPIDGTTSFVHDLAGWCVSIGVRENGRSVAGAVYSPRLDELFTAAAGCGAFLNGERIHVSDCQKLAPALFATGFGCVRAGIRPDNFDYLPPLARASCGFRCEGSAALDLCHVAVGRVDGFWEVCLKPYDVAAGDIIVREAGGVVTDFTGGQNYPQCGTIAANPKMHALLLPHFCGGTKSE